MMKSVVIVGAGPAGCALACLLAKRNIQTTVFDDDKRPDLLVGESLVPAVIPFLRRLGIEEDVARISEKKFGAALRHPNGQRADFTFRRLGKSVPNYSYNIPRPEFDRVLRNKALELGVSFVNQRATLERQHNADCDLRLSDVSMQQAGLHVQPDLLVDATGRHRLFSKLLDLPVSHGERDDISYFAHYESFDADNVVDGQVVLSVLDCGWAWQIPLKDKLSVGVVLNKNVARNFGKNPQERLENIINADAVLSQSGRNRKRVSDVMAYSNYQLVSQQAYGKGWVLLGDAFGFVDPMLSPGVFMALESADLLDRHIFAKNDISDTALAAYAKEHYQWHRDWDTLIKYFYDGRLLNLHKSGEEMVKNSSRFSLGRFMKWYIGRVLSSMVAGVSTRSQYKLAVLKHCCEFLLKDEDVSQYKIKSNSTGVELESSDGKTKRPLDQQFV